MVVCPGSGVNIGGLEAVSVTLGFLAIGWKIDEDSLGSIALGLRGTVANIDGS